MQWQRACVSLASTWQGRPETGRFIWVLACMVLVLLPSCDTPKVVPGFYGDLATASRYVDVSDWTITNTTTQSIYFPSKDGCTVNPDVKPCPVVLLVPGFNVPPNFYYSYGEQLASWGYIVLFGYYFAFDNNLLAQEVSDHIDWLIERNAQPGGFLEGAIDATRIGVTGHSIGGKYILMAALNDDRIGAIVPIEPVDASASFGEGSPKWPSFTPESMPDITAPTCFIGTPYDSLFSPADENYHQFYIHAQCIAQEVVVQKCDHASFIDDLGGYTLDFMHLGFGQHEADDDMAKTIAARYMTAWFNVHLRGMNEFETYLTGAEAQQDVDDGLVAITKNY